MATLADWISQLWAFYVAELAALNDRISQFWAFFVANNEEIASLGALIGGGIGIWLLFIRTRAVDRSARAALEQAETAADRHNAQTDADRERRITESFAKAVEQLGSEKLETRLGGIYTLERLSRESEREYWPIMETLTAYVRERAPWLPRQAVEDPSSERPEDQEKEIGSSNKGIRPATDVQAILTIIGRRKEEMRNREGENQRLDLSATDLRGVKLEGAHLERANLAGACLEDAYLHKARLDHAILWGTHLKSAYLIKSHLEYADISRAHLEYAWLWKAHLKHAKFWETHLEHAKLWEADLEHAKLWGTHLEGAWFGEAYFEDAHHGRRYFEDAKNLTQEQINSAFGDENTRLPKYLKSKRPAHWTKH